MVVRDDTAWELGGFFSALNLQMFTEAVFSFGILKVKVFHMISKVATQMFLKSLNNIC